MPSTIYWTGGAPKIAQVRTYTFATAGSIGDVITVTVGSKIWTYTTTSATISVFLPLFLTALNALDDAVYPEFAEIVFTNPTASTIVATAATAGIPFTCTLATNSAGTTINGGASSAGTATTANKSPYDISSLANYSGGVLPVSGDTLYIDREGSRLYYNLDSQSAVVLAVRRITAQDVRIGLPKTNVDGTAYPEYRSDYWQCTATSDYVNTASGRIKLDHLTGQTTYEQDASGSGLEQGIPAVLLKGTHASNAWNIFGGQAGLAFHAGDSCRVTTFNQEAGTTVILGIGCTNNTINNYGGTLYVYSAISVALNHPGTAGAKTTIEGSGAVAQITSQGGTIDYNTTGTLGGNTVLANNAVLTVDGDQRTKTITNAISLYSTSARFSDKNGVVSGGYTLKWANCKSPISGAKPNVQAIISAL